MNVKDFPSVTPGTHHDMPHRHMSRDQGNHFVTTTLLGCIAAAAVLAVLWGLYAYG